jgi:hypothetical protein
MLSVRNRVVTGTALAALCLIVLGEGVFLSLSEPLTGLPVLQPTADDATLVAKRRLLSSADAGIVLVGDSSCMMGLDPVVLTAGGLPATVNLGALLSFTVAGFADLGEEALARLPHARVLVLAVLPRSLEVTEQRAREFDLLGRYLTAYGRRSPSYSVGAADVWSWFVRKHRLTRFPPEFGGSFEEFAERIRASSGHLSEKGRYAGARSNEVQREFRPSDLAGQALSRLARAAKQRGIPFVVWWSPSPEDAVTPAYLEAAHSFVTNMASAPDAPIDVSPPPAAWPAAEFGSITHVTQAGAERNSTELAGFLASRVALH